MDKIKGFYTDYSDEIIAKRFHSKYAVRRYAHARQYGSVCSFVDKGDTVLDAGCGQGALSVMLAQKGAIVSGTDISIPNVDASKKYAEEAGVTIHFEVADLENLPFPDNSFDVVVCSHVLEHIPDFDKGLQEIYRVARKKVVFAVPTIISPCSWVQVGGGQYYLKGLRSFASLPIGFLKMVHAFILGREGVDEGYAGNDVPHVFRFPSVLRKKLKKYGYHLETQEASSLLLPFFESLLPLSRALDTLSKKPLFRNFGYGTTFVIDKEKSKAK
jgi:ubiquinone/menaquinone biosynthesis C-methylase UbiE